jgi:hypothetical protein
MPLTRMARAKCPALHSMLLGCPPVGDEEAQCGKLCGRLACCMAAAATAAAAALRTAAGCGGKLCRPAAENDAVP